LVFADPPYAFEPYEELLAGVAPLLAQDGEVVVEHSSRREMPLEAGPLVRVDVRRYGESSLSFYRSC
jgi:16S rRNA G966 N2-methylase RsmD